LLCKSCYTSYRISMDAMSERIATNIRKGVLEYCVLALLSERDRYGLELASELVARGLTASEGSLYPLLARMLAAGVVDTRWETIDGGRPRKYYAATSAGRVGLQRFAEVWRSISPEVNELVMEQSR
jgi:PadR family transcriptional regulator, regulatory protein PadR